MPHVLVRLTVEDYARWKAVFDDYGKVRATFGSKGGHLFRSADNPNEVHILLEFEDMAREREFYASPELRETMQKAGVQGRPDVYYLEEVGHLEA